MEGFRKAEGSPFGFSNLATHSYPKQHKRMRSSVITFRSPVETAKNNKLDGCQNVAIPEATTLFWSDSFILLRASVSPPRNGGISSCEWPSSSSERPIQSSSNWNTSSLEQLPLHPYLADILIPKLLHCRHGQQLVFPWFPCVSERWELGVFLHGRIWRLPSNGDKGLICQRRAATVLQIGKTRIS